ncbi:MAG: DUF4097 family beta strand repeat-containing protein, partial [Clostridium sp.]|nr:DUF4097 family beta strand repeat-containing protein [Clostridium sp.]
MNFNIKKIVLGLLGILLISYGIAACIFLTQYKSNYFVKRASNYNTSKNLNTDGIKKIYVDTSESSINVTTNNEHSAKVNVSGTLSTTNRNNKPELNCYKQGDTLYIEFKRKNNMSLTLFNNSDINMNISIPKSYNNDLSVYCSYGKINLDNLKVKNITCSNSAGKITGDNINCSTSSIDSSAGDIELTNFRGDISSKNSAGKTIIQYAK